MIRLEGLIRNLVVVLQFVDDWNLPAEQRGDPRWQKYWQQPEI